jgi:glycosyltransferase involved in cell wall biosynthesis
MWRRPPDALFIPAHVLPRIIPKRSIVTIHDIGFHRHPELYKPVQVRYHEWSTRDIVKRASRILTVSEFSKREIVEVYGAEPSRIVVTPLGIDHTRFHPIPHERVDATLHRLRFPQPYLLFMGRLELKKNIGVLIEAFTRYKQTRGVGDPLRLILAGLPGVGFDALEQQIAASPAKDTILLPGYIGEEDKPALMAGAEALIHPSWYEGFGLPPLEAMACGCPVVCSRVASLPEVVGEANALWFDPANPDELAERLLEIRGDAHRYNHLRSQGLTWAQRYTWGATARQTFIALTQWS